MMMHIQMKIDTALEMANGTKTDQRRLEKMFGFPDVRQIQELLYKMKSEGLEVNSSEDCDHRSKTGECLGHPEPSI